MNGTMISARPRTLMKDTFLKHFALEVWVSIVATVWHHLYASTISISPGPELGHT